jgi:cell division topological specificity factor
MGIFNRLLGRSTKGSSAVARERLQLILVHDRIDLPPAHLEAMKEEILAVIAKYVSIDSGKVDIALHQRERENMLVAEIPFLKPIESMDIDELVRLPDRDSIDSSSMIVDDESELIGLPTVDNLNMDVLLWEDDTQRNRAITTADITAAETIDENDPVFKSKASDLANNGYSIFDESGSDLPALIAEPEFLDDDTQRNRAITDADIAAADIVAANIVANEAIETLDLAEADNSYIADTDHGHHASPEVDADQSDASTAWSEDPPIAADVLDATPVDSAVEVVDSVTTDIDTDADESLSEPDASDDES